MTRYVREDGARVLVYKLKDGDVLYQAWKPGWTDDLWGRMDIELFKSECTREHMQLDEGEEPPF